MTNVLLRGTHRDRWLLSYADFITVLFAAFVLMFAAAKAKEHTGPGSIGPASPAATQGQQQVQPPTQPNNIRPVDSNLLTDLRQTLDVEQKTGVVTVSVDQRGIVIALDDKLCFQPGQAVIESVAIPMFVHVGQVLSRHGNRVLLEGHTDSMPIHTAQFRSNWELSTARSIAVMELMEQKVGMAAQRFLIGGSADNAPVAQNDTEQGRAHNRRVEIVVLDAMPADVVSAQHPAVTAPR
jgi:chemotaxis protein MotB